MKMQTHRKSPRPWVFESPHRKTLSHPSHCCLSLLGTSPLSWGVFQALVTSLGRTFCHLSYWSASVKGRYWV